MGDKRTDLQKLHDEYDQAMRALSAVNRELSMVIKERDEAREVSRYMHSALVRNNEHFGLLGDTGRVCCLPVAKWLK